MNEYEAKLSDETLYLLRLKAMAEEVVGKDYSCTTHEMLYSYLMDPEHEKQYINNQENGGPYFENLRKAIGKKEESKSADEDYKVSVTTLKRLYGKARSKQPVSMNTLNYIAEFISDSQYKWDELQERVDILTEELEMECLWQGSMRIPIRRPKGNGKVGRIYSSKLVKGDKVKVTFNSGRTLGLYYEGDYKYKVTATMSSILKGGYTMMIVEMHRGGRVASADVCDEKGEPIEEDGYESDVILTIEFQGSSEAEWQRVCTALRGDSSD